MKEESRLNIGRESSSDSQLRSGGPSKLRPISRSEHTFSLSPERNRSIFQDFLSTHLTTEENENSRKPLLETNSEKPSISKEKRPKLSRQKGRTNSAFEDESSRVVNVKQEASHLSAASTLRVNNQAMTRQEPEVICGADESQEMKELKVPKKPKRKKNKLKETEKLLNSGEPTATSELQGDLLEGNNTADEQILGIIIHGTERLNICSPISLTHPVVKVHILEVNTGQYFRKTERNRAVTSYYECQSVEYILPVMTQPFIINQQNPSPLWEELLLFNENFSSFIQADPATLVVFEIMDFLSPSSSAFHIKSEDKGWYPIAWAFLKPRGGNGHLNSGHKVCLQLYKAPPPSTFFFSSKRKAPHVYEWWKGDRQKYLGCLYVTFKPLHPPEDVQPALRSMIPMQQERSISQNENEYENERAFRTPSNKSSPKKAITSPQKSSPSVLSPWSRLPGQTCRVPLQQILCLSTSSKGNFRIRFSPDGCFLACASCTSSGSPINIYEVPTGSEIAELKGHIGLIYDLDWNLHELQLLSASADATVRVWNPTTSICSICVIPHPSYVYAAKFHPSPGCKLIVTAGYDRIIRVWQLPLVGSKLQLLQELEGHKASINALCWGQSDAIRLYSGDSSGTINCWLQGHGSSKMDFELENGIRDKSIQGRAINSLNIVPNSKKIITETRDGCFISIHLYKHVVTRVYDSKLPNTGHFFGRGCLSPCGNLLFGLAEGTMESEMQILVWNTLNGAQVHKYNDLPINGSRISCVDFHPLDHIVAFSVYGKNGCVLVYGLESKGPLKALPSVVSTATGTPSRECIKETTNPQSFSEENQLRLHRVLRKLDSVLSLSSKN